jgi:hypothetical protein
MRVRVTTASGASYCFDMAHLTWERNSWKPINGFVNTGSDPNVSRGTLYEAPVIVIGRQIHFDDVRVGQIITTTVVKAEII